MNLFIGARRVTEEEQRALIDKMRKKLQEIALQEGDILVCKAKTQYGIIAQWMCCQELGLIPFFVAPDYPVENSRFMEYADVSYLLKLDEQETIRIEKLSRKTGPHLNVKPGSVIHMTSATSGNPKFILRTKEQLDLEVSRYCKRLQLTEKDVIMSIAPFYHAYAFLCPMLGSIYTNATLVQPDVLLPRNVIEICREQKVTCLYGVPFFIEQMADTDKKYQLSEELRYVISSGEKLTAKTAHKFYDRFGIGLNQQYGCTEMGTVTFAEALEPDESQGRPIEGVEFKIEEIEGKSYISVNTNGTMGFYIQEEVRPIAEGFYLSNDLGHFDAEGHLYIDGRGDDVIIRAGEKINLREISTILEKMDGVQGVKLEVGKDSLKEITCYYNAEREIDKNEFLEYCKQHFSAFQIPNYYHRTQKPVGQTANWKHKK